jgi:hypothetical protein
MGEGRMKSGDRVIGSSELQTDEPVSQMKLRIAEIEVNLYRRKPREERLV